MKVSVVRESSMQASLQISAIEYHKFLKRIIIDILKMCIFKEVWHKI